MLTKRQQARLVKRVTTHRKRLYKLGSHLMKLDLNRQEIQTLLAFFDAAQMQLSEAVSAIDTFPTIRSDPPQ